MDKTILLIISILINAILGICVFFKSALNEILKEYWQNRCNRKKEINHKIIELRRQLSIMRNTSTLSLITLASWKRAQEPDEKAMYKKHLDDSVKEWSKSYRSIENDEIYYPTKMQSALRKFFEKYQKFNGEILEIPMYKERLLEMSDYVNSSIDEIIEMIDSQRKKLIS